jgi:hypothetical protein
MHKTNPFSTKTTIAGVSAATLLLVLAPTMIAFAQNPHFVGRTNCEVDSSGNLDCTGSIAGLGNVEDVEAFLVADIDATFVCVNPGGNIAPGQGVEEEDVTGETETLPVRNGRANFDLTIEAPEAPSAEEVCANPNWTVELQSISYDNVRVTVDGAVLPIEGGPFEGEV